MSLCVCVCVCVCACARACACVRARTSHKPGQAPDQNSSVTSLDSLEHLQRDVDLVELLAALLDVLQAGDHEVPSGEERKEK